ncbi:glutamate--tRNA ligase [Candidatus Gracilibacteria bacterium]|nr:glutamate--tRNA ligase [Candidatus Gracilibacteria bacterium]MCF7898915.1 glutamate--tRNA ligase [Candidatus Paceibacterota bacterium]
MVTSKIVTRFAPSPTGLLHMGNYRTAVFAYMFAKKNGGKFILRIEDTDRERSKKEYEDNIVESLEWLGLSYDEKYRQSEHVESHTKYLQKLINDGKAYISKEEAKDGSGVIRELVRFKNNGQTVIFEDAIRGKIETDTKDLGDFVIAKSISEPLFHIAVVVDDYEEGVTHILRGEDHIPNTPRQILIREALGFPQPIYAHLPLVLSEDRTKLSKRKGALPVTDYRDMGYLPSAILNFMAFIGFNPGGEKEIFTLDELVEVFDITKIHKGGAIFNKEKLSWVNKEHIKLQSVDVQLKSIERHMKDYPEDMLKKLLPTVIEKISNYGDLATVDNTEFRFFIKRPVVDVEKIVWKNSNKSEASQNLKSVKGLLLKADFSSPDSLKQSIMEYAEKNGKGNVLWPLRMALSGQEKSVDPFTICYVLGVEEVVIRIDNACQSLDS